jgi:hypothetical protein
LATEAEPEKPASAGSPTPTLHTAEFIEAKAAAAPLPPVEHTESGVGSLDSGRAEVSKTAAEKKAAQRAASPAKREPIAAERLPVEGARDAKPARAKAKPAPTATASEFFRTMGDD